MQDIFDAITSFVDKNFRDLSDTQRDIIRDNMEIALMEGAKKRGLRSLLPQQLTRIDASFSEPVRDLSDDEVAAILEVGRKLPWEGRGADDQSTSVEWVLQHYGHWVPGLLRNHIRQADIALYGAFMKKIGRAGLPDAVDIPTREENDARVRAARWRMNPEVIDQDMRVIGERASANAWARALYRSRQERSGPA